MEASTLIAPPAKMCKPSVLPLNAFAVCVQWVPPVDVAAQRGGGFSGNRSQLIRGYRLRYQALGLDDKPLGDFVDVNETWPPESSQATLKWLQSGLAYTFEVSAFNDAGEGDWSYSSDPFLMPRRPDELDRPPLTAPPLSSRASRNLPPLPGLPGSRPSTSTGQEGQSLAISKSPDSIELAWKPPCHRGAPIVAYDIKYSKDPKFTPATTRELIVAGNSNKVIVEGLDSNTIYYFMHRARNEVGSSGWSNVSTAIATLARKPEAPSAPVRMGPSHTWQATEISIKWEAPDSDGMPIQHYHVNVGRQPDMSDALEVEIGSKAGSGTITGHTVVAAPSTPRPGFSKDLYALTQLKVRGLRPNTEYYFQVRASCSSGQSPWSAPSVPMKTTTAPPERCGQVKFISGSCREGIRMYWSPPDSYDLPITRYDIRVSRSTTMKDAVAELSDVEFRGTTLEDAQPGDLEAVALGPECFWVPGVDHFCQVRAWNTSGAGKWSQVSEPMPVAAEPPAMPEAPRNFTSWPTAIIVRWLAPNCLGSPITGYRLRYSTAREMEDPVLVKGLEGTGTEFPVTDLQPDIAHFFQVAADNKIGEGPWSPPSQPVAALQLPPVRMTPPFLVSSTQKSVTVGFEEFDCSDPLRRQLIQGYTVLYRPKPVQDEGPVGGRTQGFRRIPGADSKGTECVGLFPGKVCEVCVLAVNAFGEGEVSEVVELLTASAEPAPPQPPTALEVEATTVTVAVTPGADNGDAPFQFLLEVQELGEEDTWEIGPVQVVDALAEDGRLVHRINNLVPGRSYRCRASVENAIGNSGWSGWSEGMDTVASRPEVVLQVQVTEVASMSFKIRWDSPEDNGSKVEKYTVAWMVDTPTEPENTPIGRVYAKALRRDWREATTTETYFTCEGCVQGCVAYVKVAAHNEVGLSDFTKPLKVRLKPDIPLPPLPPTFSQVSFTSFRVSWAMLFDGGDDVLGFRIHFVETDSDGRPEAARDQGEIIVDAQKMQKDLYNMAPTREYVVRVAAENPVGVGPYSKFSQPQRLLRPRTPGTPGKPVCMSATVSSLKVRLQLPGGNGSNILEQVFRVSENPECPADDCLEIVLPSHAPVNKPFAPKSPPPSSGSGRRPYGSRPGTGAEAPPSREVPPGGTAAEPGTMTLEDAPRDLSEQDLQALAALRISGEMRLKRTVPSELTFELPRLKGGTAYYVCCAARNSIGTGSFGPVGGPMTTKQAAPLATTKLSFCGKDTQSVSLAWDMPDNRGADIISYALRYMTEEDRLLEDDTDRDEGTKKPPEKKIEVTLLEDPNHPRYRIGHLLPGTHYFAAVRSLNALGWSPWVRADGSCRTDPMPPAKMDPLEAVLEERTTDSITLAWSIPDHRGSRIHAIELRYINVALEALAGLNEEQELERVLEGHAVLLEPEGVGEPLPLRYRLQGLMPHSIVVAIARALNGAGAGEWSDAPSRDLSRETLDVELVAAPAEPSAPQAPVFDLESLTTESGSASFTLGSSNGLLYVGLGFRLYAGPPGLDVLEMETPLAEDPKHPELVLREWYEEVTREENQAVLQGELQFSRLLEDLQPGTVYAMQVRAENPVGSSPWSSVGPTARTKAKAPRPCVLQVDHITPTAIWLKWKPPHHNGSHIKGYRLRWNKQSVDLPLEEWEDIAEADLNSNLVRSDVTPGAWVFKLTDLLQNHGYHFQLLCWNKIGFSEWSERVTFNTRPSPPARPHQPEFVSVEAREATLRWTAPDDHGSPLQRYEIVCARTASGLNWARLPSEKLGLTPSLEAAFGLFGVVDHASHEGYLEAGRESLSAYRPETAFYVEVDAASTSYNLADLLPGTMYFAMVRAVSDKGNGSWSMGASVRTEPCRPGIPQPMRIEQTTAGDCFLSFTLPHAHGRSIEEAVIGLVRMDGPLGDDDVDYESGDVHPHHVRRELSINPFAEPFASEWGEERYACTVAALLPATEYEVSFACRNECGLGDFSDGTRFTTKSGLPDLPQSMFAASGF